MPATIEYSDAGRANLENIEAFLGIEKDTAIAMFRYNYRVGLASVLNTWVDQHRYGRNPSKLVVKVKYSTVPNKNKKKKVQENKSHWSRSLTESSLPCGVF